MNCCSREKFPFKIAVVWLLCILLIFTLSEPELLPNVVVPASRYKVISIVLIAMGSLAENSIIDSAVGSIRVLGKWEGHIHILSDRPECFNWVASKHNVIVTQVPTVDNIIQIKAMKTKLFSYLPQDISSVLYLDVDILVTRSLNLFLSDMYQQLEAKRIEKEADPDFGMFLDARGHFFGFCSGCDKWHTGVIWLQRNSTTGPCMTAWREILLSGKYDTDQESIDEADSTGKCKHNVAFSSRHLLFAKDYFASFLTPSRTFVHLTAISRLDTQDYFYQYYIVPGIKSSLRPAGLNLLKYDHQKKCSHMVDSEVKASVD